MVGPYHNCLPKRYGLHFCTASTKPRNIYIYIICVDKSICFLINAWLKNAMGRYCSNNAPTPNPEVSHSTTNFLAKSGRANKEA